MANADLPRRIAAALVQDPRLTALGGQLEVTEFPPGSGAIALAGTVSHLAGKRIAGLIAERVDGVRRVENHVRVEPVQPRPDAEVREAVVHALMEDPFLVDQDWRVDVRDGVVTLTGCVQTPVRKRLAAALAWWVPSVRDVDDRLTTREAEEDLDAEIAEACRVVLEKDPLVDATEVLVRSHHGVVRLSGAVEDDVVRDAAEYDCWAVPGVRDVVNDLVVVPIR